MSRPKLSNVIDFKTRRPVITSGVYLLYSDNYDGALVTRAALKELQLLMSTGDYHTHTAVECDPQTAAELQDLGRALLTIQDI